MMAWQILPPGTTATMTQAQLLALGAMTILAAVGASVLLFALLEQASKGDS